MSESMSESLEGSLDESAGFSGLAGDGASGSAGSVAEGVSGGMASGGTGRQPSGGTCRRNTILGYIAGIVTGVTYGLNPLFAKPLLEMGVSVDTMLSIRYLLAVVILGIWLVARKESLRVKH